MKNTYVIVGNVVHIHLTHERTTQIDLADLPRAQAMRSTWVYTKGRTNRTGYVHALVRDPNTGRRQHVYLHRWLCRLTEEHRYQQVDHVNNDGLDNRRRANLRIVSHVDNLAKAQRHQRRISDLPKNIYQDGKYYRVIKTYAGITYRHSSTSRADAERFLESLLYHLQIHPMTIAKPRRGRPREIDDATRLTVSFAESTMSRIDALAKHSDRSRANVIRALVDAGFETLQPA